VTAATNFLARQGLLVTLGGALERLARADRAVLDKTGTLTRGRLHVAGVELAGGTSREEALAVAAALEQASEHPIARAFRDIDPAGEARVSVRPGRGVEGVLAGKRYRLGAPAFAAELPGKAAAELAGDDTAVVLADETDLLAVFRIADEARPGLASDVAELARLGVDAEIASGDAAEPVAGMARAAGISRWRARQSPEDKLARIRELQAEGCTVVMVGDGVNDAPVLAGADVSVAMGSGTALAQTSADLVLLGESLGPLALGLATARRARRVIAQNLAWAGGYNLVALPLAAAGFVQPWMAAIGMSASSLLVVLNALRLSRARAQVRAGARALPREAGA
jgi:Cu2+-exporting ATPase